VKNSFQADSSVLAVVELPTLKFDILLMYMGNEQRKMRRARTVVLRKLSELDGTIETQISRARIRKKLVRT
jgi:hypothetical protein